MNVLLVRAPIQLGWQNFEEKNGVRTVYIPTCPIYNSIEVHAINKL
jgi:hypothetical protein